MKILVDVMLKETWSGIAVLLFACLECISKTTTSNLIHCIGIDY